MSHDVVQPVDPVASSQRLLLRPLRDDVLPAVNRWLGDPEVTRYWIRQTQPSLAELHDWLAANRNAGSITLAIEKHDGTPIGYIDVFDIDLEHRRCEISLMIGERAEWGRGYAREALRLLLGYLFETLEMHKVTLSVFADNEAARRVYLACGFREDGVLRDDMYRDGRWHDQILMSILESEFQQRDG
jgi:RimJ/RimL family protein N-acetyltransferase